MYHLYKDQFICHEKICTTFCYFLGPIKSYVYWDSPSWLRFSKSTEKGALFRDRLKREKNLTQLRISKNSMVKKYLMLLTSCRFHTKLHYILLAVRSAHEMIPTQMNIMYNQLIIRRICLSTNWLVFRPIPWYITSQNGNYLHHLDGL
jgi:hypothetical protein